MSSMATISVVRLVDEDDMFCFYLVIFMLREPDFSVLTPQIAYGLVSCYLRHIADFIAG